MNYSKHALGSKIKLVIKNSRFNQKEIAKELRITETTLSNYVAGKRLPDAILVASLATLCNASINWLLLGEGDMSLEKSIQPAVENEQLTRLREELRDLRIQNSELIQQLISLTKSNSFHGEKLAMLEVELKRLKVRVGRAKSTT